MKAKGVQDWLVQRISALILAGYLFFLLAYCLAHRGLSFEQWHHLFTLPSMRIITSFVILSLVWHAWIGMWTVITDYLKCSVVRFSAQIIIIFVLLGCLIWGLRIVWSQ